MSMSMPPQQQMPQFGQQMPMQMTGQMTGMNGMNGFQGYQQQPYRQVCHLLQTSVNTG